MIVNQLKAHPFQQLWFQMIVNLHHLYSVAFAVAGWRDAAGLSLSPDIDGDAAAALLSSLAAVAGTSKPTRASGGGGGGVPASSTQRLSSKK